MAAQVITGLTGTIAMKNGGSSGTAVNQRLASISITTGQALFDISAYGQEGWVERIGGIKDLAGSAAGFLVYDDTDTDPFSLVDNLDYMTITFFTGCSIAFDCVVGNVRIEGAYSGLNILTFDWAKADASAPTVTWDETGA